MMITVPRPLLLTTALLVFLSLMTPTDIHAAGYGLSLSPPLLKVNIKPDKTITQVFTITNTGNEDKLLVARMVPFTQSDFYGNPQLDLKSSPSWLNYFSLANTNIKLGSPFTVKAKSSEQLIVTLAIPANTLLRDLYATLLISTYSNISSLNYQGSQVSATIGANLLITLHPDISPPTILKINRLLPQAGAFFKFGHYYFADNITPLTFSATVKNDGNFTSETKGIFRFTGRHEVPLYLEGVLPVYVISNSQRTLVNTLGKDFSFSPNLSNVGLHKAILQINADNSHAENSVDIFFFPFKILAGLIFASIFLTVIFRTTKSKDLFDR